jgi:hypothetical protein
MLVRQVLLPLETPCQPFHDTFHGPVGYYESQEVSRGRESRSTHSLLRTLIRTFKSFCWAQYIKEARYEEIDFICWRKWNSHF